ncbi:uncharacterized protein LOC127242393 isoform X3 [Andrographis paniculata]|uniref:uncharacterized protein LOC127242393 isoform X3 n=1 Tax=Andrographis paniculata TaxID=175694 RepID=UPI0021E728A5|nr:uncharacterized protein LOC127242393 isoform X3 [Andrographis paniculata]
MVELGSDAGTSGLEGCDHVPLKQRLKLLLASRSDENLDGECPSLLKNEGASVAGEWEDEHSDSQVSGQRSGLLVVSEEEESGDELEECEESVKKSSTSLSDTTADPHHGAKFPIMENVECAENVAESTSMSYLHDSSLARIQPLTFEPEMSEEYLEELENVSLKDRLGMLLSRELTPSILQEDTTASVKGDLKLDDQCRAENQMCEIDKILKLDVSRCSEVSSYKPHQELGCSQGNVPTCVDDKAHSSEKQHSRYEPDSINTLPCSDSKIGQGSASQTFAKVKIELPTYDEPQTSYAQMDHEIPFGTLIPKTDVQNAEAEYEDELDHMVLRERMKLPLGDGPSLNINEISKYESSGCSPALGYESVASETARTLKINRSRTRRKTVTDSVETAMEEDAPGLLKILIEEGVSVNDIKLYSVPESNDTLDDSSTNDNVEELEEIKSKRESIVKLGLGRSNKGERAAYCLECLLSLVEQAQFFQSHKCPAEWGWCRDLQSFIFVFEKHNRIVLERPEYGFAMYFFEMVDSLSSSWQIQRLVTTMKLTSLGRASLIENKPLMVGKDLTEGEARVLTGFGWVPNTGLGTMLHYYDRVIHDKKKHSRSEWKSKIVKFLMDGYHGGRIVYTGSVPPKVEDSDSDANPGRSK